MTNLTPADQWDGIYQLEENDPVQGGVGGVSNLPLQNLTNRTERIHQSLLDVGIDIVNKVYSNPTTTDIGPVRKATDLEIQNGSSVVNAFIDPEQFKKYNGVVETIDDLRLKEGYDGEIAYLKCRATNGDGGHGIFVWSTADLSAEVAADTLSGIYVAPASDLTGASGAWVRQYSGRLPVSVFGGLSSPSLQATINMMEQSGFPYFYIPTFENDITLSDALVFKLGDIRIFGDVGIRLTHPFKDATPRIFRKGYLYVDATADCAVDIGGYDTAGTARNPAMSFTLDHLAIRGCGTKIKDGIQVNAWQNGPHRPIIFDNISGYNLNRGIYVSNTENVTTNVAGLTVRDCSFNYGNYGILSDGACYNAIIEGSNLEGNASGCVHGMFLSLIINSNMLENTKNPVHITTKGSGSQLVSRNNYFEYHPTSEYLYRVDGAAMNYQHYIDINNNFYSGLDWPINWPDSHTIFNGAGRVLVNSNRHITFQDVRGVIVKKGSTILDTQKEYVFDQGFTKTYECFFGPGSLNSIDADGSWIHDYPTTNLVSMQTPFGPQNCSDMVDGIQINPGENVSGKLVVHNFLLYSPQGALPMVTPQNRLSVRTAGGVYVSDPGTVVEYLANDIINGEWTIVTLVWRPVASTYTLVFYINAALAGKMYVAGATTKVLGAYAADGTNPIYRVTPVRPNFL